MKRLLLSSLLLGVSIAAYADNLRYFGQTPQSYQSQIDYGNNANTGHYVLSDDTRIYYEVYGKGEPIVVLHGGLVGSTAEMGQFIDELAKNRQVIAISTRGHGKSEIGQRVPSYEQKARDVQAVLNQQKIAKTDLLGFSDGAYTAMMFAKNYPSQTQKVVAIGAGEWVKGARHLGDGNFEPFAQLDPAYWAEQATIRPEPKRTADWFAQSIAYYNELDYSQAIFKQIASPVLLVVGEEDQNAPLDTVFSAYKALPNADLAVVADAPHPAFATHFRAVWAAVEAFLAKP
ncbi:alpha/beta fold hydrolase [Mannheimia granulomatis]|uniref:alpha/beta fold hydrolase n=1 Tax=Mannheimia granulomatis TaxID=85402 RepID=UPI000A8EF0CE|nr:alpha/beta hydrolase [Mannheimia granulomatis]